MRRSLTWALLATLALSAASLWWPRARPSLVAAVQRSETVARTETWATADGPAGPSRRPALPATLQPWDLPLALNDPFNVAAPPAASPPQARPAAPAPTIAVPPPSPPPPPATMPAVPVRYLGSMLTPQGDRLILLLRGDTPFIARTGLGFEDGFVIQSVEPQAVRLLHASTGVGIDIAVPAPLDAPGVSTPAPEPTKPVAAASGRMPEVPTR